MLRTLFVSLLLSMVTAICLAAEVLPKGSYSGLKCQKELSRQLRKVFKNSKPLWMRQVDTDFETQAYRSRTEKVGEWYELRLTEKQYPKLLFYSAKKTVNYDWDKACKLSEKTGPGFELFALSKNADEFLTDSDLESLLKVHKKGVIYMWSPRMTYSVTEFKRFRETLQKKNLTFIPILDPFAEVQEAKEALKKAGVELPGRLADQRREPSSFELYRRLNSVDLYMRNVTLHFPTFIVFKNGQLHPHRLVGVLTDEGLNQAVDEQLGDLP